MIISSAFSAFSSLFSSKRSTRIISEWYPKDMLTDRTDNPEIQQIYLRDRKIEGTHNRAIPDTENRERERFSSEVDATDDSQWLRALLKIWRLRHASPYASSCQRCVRPWQNLSIFWDVASLLASSLSPFEDFFLTRRDVESISNMSRESAARGGTRNRSCLDPLSQINNHGNAGRMEGILRSRALCVLVRGFITSRERVFTLLKSVQSEASCSNEWSNIAIIFDYLVNWNCAR